VDLEVKNDGAPTKVVFDPQIPAGAEQIEARCDNRAVAAHPEKFTEDEHVKVEIEAASGATHCHIRLAGGVFVFTRQPAPQTGDDSTAIKITQLHLQNHDLQIDADVNASGSSTFFIQSAWKIVAFSGATVLPLSDHRYQVTVQASSARANSLGFAPTHVEIGFSDK